MDSIEEKLPFTLNMCVVRHECFSAFTSEIINFVLLISTDVTLYDEVRKAHCEPTIAIPAF